MAEMVAITVVITLAVAITGVVVTVLGVAITITGVAIGMAMKIVVGVNQMNLVVMV